MSRLDGLEPKEVFRFFEEICKIPHESGNCGAISAFLRGFAEQKGLQCDSDVCGNVLIRKPASVEYEKYETIVLQGHMDMVCEKAPGVDFDFDTDAIRPYVDGDFIRAEGTTLGGDNGIAVAMMLALLADDQLKHPQVEMLFTVDEETSMEGAFGFDCGKLTGHRLLNLDSEYEGVLMCSCAGGADVEGSFAANRENCTGSRIRIEIGGLTGGHSGVEIDKGRANANILMGRLLHQLQKAVPLHICSYYGGNRVNAIASAAQAEIVVGAEDLPMLEQKVGELTAVFREEYHAADPKLFVRFEKTEDGTFSALDTETTERIISLLTALPDGMQEMSQEMPGLVQTSCNLGAAELREEGFFFTSSVRSAVNSKKDMLVEKILQIIRLTGGEGSRSGDYPGWAYNPDSLLKNTVLEAYQKVCGIEASVEAVHAGMECGIFAASIPDLDCVSIGPTMGEVHTPGEYLSIASVDRTYQVLRYVLENARYLQ